MCTVYFSASSASNLLHPDVTEVFWFLFVLKLTMFLTERFAVPRWPGKLMNYGFLGHVAMKLIAPVQRWNTMTELSVTVYLQSKAVLHAFHALLCALLYGFLCCRQCDLSRTSIFKNSLYRDIKAPLARWGAPLRIEEDISVFCFWSRPQF